MARNRPGNGPHSKLLARGSVNGRSRNGRFLAAVREELTQHFGGGPLTARQRILVERVAWLRLHVALFDEKVADCSEPMSDRDRASYLAFSNSLVRATRELGLGATATATPMDAISYGRALAAEDDAA